ncbi:MAG: hypothetical protein ACW964_02500 [Candidatus Hodarchaeales archaeon]|jgi:hypothetical protein
MKSNPKKGQNELKDRRLLFSFWRDIPTIRFVDESFFTIMNQEVRSEILDLLREGILDDSVFNNGKTRRRYALNAQELQKHIEERLHREITLSNVYFHLQKLKEIDCIQELVSIREGKYNVAYFSRTAKLFSSSLRDSDKTRKKLNALKKLFIRLLPSLNPTIKKETIMNLFDEIYQYRLEREKLRFIWLEKHAEFLTDLEFDILIIDKFLMELDGSDVKGSRLYSQVSDILNYI